MFFIYCSTIKAFSKDYQKVLREVFFRQTIVKDSAFTINYEISFKGEDIMKFYKAVAMEKEGSVYAT